jgi:hypothetical protein
MLLRSEAERISIKIENFFANTEVLNDEASINAFNTSTKVFIAALV